jgi:hypothetical protein
MSNKTDKKAGSESSPETSPVVTNHTVTAKSHFGVIGWEASQEVDSTERDILANEGYEARIASVTSKLDAVFGNYGHKGPDGKAVKRPASYERKNVKFSPENAEIVRAAIAQSDAKGRAIACTTSRYVPSTTVNVDVAAIVMAQNAIAKKTTVEELKKLAATVSFEGNDLSVNNDAFVNKVAEFYATL